MRTTEDWGRNEITYKEDWRGNRIHKKRNEEENMYKYE